MNQSTREKIALVVFLALILATLAGIGAYIHMGNSWNQAAISIDSASGDLEGYTAIVYRGVCVPSIREAQDTQKPVPITSVVRSYREKGAIVLRLDVLHPEIYDGEDIYLVGTRRVGVFYAPETMTPFALERRVAWFKKHEVDLILCIAEDSSYLVGHSAGVDVVVSLGSETRLRAGTTIDDTYFSDVPIVGRVGTVFITPEGFLYSKEIDEMP